MRLLETRNGARDVKDCATDAWEKADGMLTTTMERILYTAGGTEDDEHAVNTPTRTGEGLPSLHALELRRRTEGDEVGEGNTSHWVGMLATGGDPA